MSTRRDAVLLGLSVTLLSTRYKDDTFSSILLLSAIAYNLCGNFTTILSPLLLKAGRGGKDLNKKGTHRIFI